MRVGLHLVRAQTPEQSVIISNLHSGSLRYYGSRMTYFYEFMRTEWGQLFSRY